METGNLAHYRQYLLYTFRDIATYATEISFYFRMQTCDFRISIERLTGEKEKACVHDISSVQVKSRSFYPNINKRTTYIHTYVDLDNIFIYLRTLEE